LIVESSAKVDALKKDATHKNNAAPSNLK